MFRIYELDLIINDIHFNEIWIDPHYENKHGNYMNDDLILKLLLHLNGKEIHHVAESSGFRYFETDIEHTKKVYRLILVIPNDECYLGIRNAYRRSK